MSQAEVEKLILKETKGLPEEAMNEILHFVEFIKTKFSVRNKKKTPHPASVSSVEEFRERVKKSQEAVARGEFLTDEEFEKETQKW